MRISFLVMTMSGIGAIGALIGCVQKGSETDGGTTSAATASGAGGAGGTSAATGGGSTTGSAGGSTTSTGPSEPLTCSEGALLAGNPVYQDGELPDPLGTGILDDPPLDWRSLSFDSTNLYSHTGEEIWWIDLGAPNPVEKRIAGERQDGLAAYGAGPCADARFGDTRGVVVRSDGSLVVADYHGNGLLAVTAPTTGACAVSFLAGNATPQMPILDNPPNPGDVDGPGATAKFWGPEFPVIDEQDNVYFIDGANNKIKKVANDGAHTVSTVTALPTDTAIWNAMTRLGSHLYVVGTLAQKDVVLDVDVTSGSITKLKEGMGDMFPPLSASELAVLSAVTTDGSSLVVAGKGHIWRLDLDGTVTHLAGIGVVVDYPPPGYDPAAPHPAEELALKQPNSGSSLGGTNQFMTYQAGALYWASAAYDSYVLRIACP